MQDEYQAKNAVIVKNRRIRRFGIIIPLSNLPAKHIHLSVSTRTLSLATLLIVIGKSSGDVLFRIVFFSAEWSNSVLLSFK